MYVAMSVLYFGLAFVFNFGWPLVLWPAALLSLYRLVIRREGKVKKLVEAVEHVSFSGRRAIAQGQHITYVTERCVMELRPAGVTVTEIAPGAELERDILAQSGFPLQVAGDLRSMDAALFQPALIGLRLAGASVERAA